MNSLGVVWQQVHGLVMLIQLPPLFIMKYVMQLQLNWEQQLLLQRH
jgi:hypothetical protein